MYLVNPSDRTILCDGVEVHIPEDTQLIFTTNITGGMIFPRELKSVYRRCQIIEVNMIPYYEDVSDNDDITVTKLFQD